MTARTKKGRNATPGKRAFTPISKALYERMYELYKAGMAAYRIAKELKVSHVTVKKYIDKGSPEHGMMPLRKRLEESNKRLRERLYDMHSKKQQKYYEEADKAFNVAMSAAIVTMRILANYQLENQKTNFHDVDHNLLHLMVRNANDATELVGKWREMVKALYVGEESQDMLKDIQEYVETGYVSPELQKTLQQVVDEGRQNGGGRGGEGAG